MQHSHLLAQFRNLAESFPRHPQQAFDFLPNPLDFAPRALGFDGFGVKQGGLDKRVHLRHRTNRPPYRFMQPLGVHAREVAIRLAGMVVVMHEAVAPYPTRRQAQSALVAIHYPAQ
ncbi:MAG: hypothetical protein NZ556_08015 [Fimbriimonadales bacterium]|nr:hypothetical protein [Fimbriimonadales bacterium]